MKKILYYAIAAMLTATVSCKKEDKVVPAAPSPPPITTPTTGSGKTPASVIAQIAFSTGKNEKDIPKDLDGQIIYGTVLTTADDLGFPAGTKLAYDYFLAGFYDANGKPYNIGPMAVNDTVIPYDSKDSSYRKENVVYYPGYPDWPAGISNSGLGFDKNATLKLFNSTASLPALPMSSESNKVVIPAIAQRNKDITVKVEGNISDGDTIIYYIGNPANHDYKRYFFPVSKVSYTFTAAQINAVIPAGADKCLIAIYVAKFNTRKLDNGKKVMTIGINGKGSTIKLTE